MILLTSDKNIRSLGERRLYDSGYRGFYWEYSQTAQPIQHRAVKTENRWRRAFFHKGKKNITSIRIK